MQGRLELPDVTWQRVSPKYVVVVFVGSLVAGAIAAAACVFLAMVAELWWAWILLGIVVAIAAIQLIIAPRRARAIGYCLRENDLVFRRGIAFQRFVAVPYGRMQLVDINRGPLSRALGLAELKFVTAAASSGIELPGLPSEEAEALRDRIVELAESRRTGL